MSRGLFCADLDGDAQANMTSYMQDELRYMAEWSARMDAQEAARSAQLQRVAAIQAAQAQEAQVAAYK